MMGTKERNFLSLEGLVCVLSLRQQFGVPETPTSC
jgi:hypothetical protein